MKKIILIAGIVAISSMFSSCKKEGCTDIKAKNFDVEAEKDDDSCEFYTKKELLTMDIWKFKSLTSTDTTDLNSRNQAFENATFQFKTDGNLVLNIPSENVSDTISWAFQSNESELLIDSDEVWKITNLEKTAFSFSFGDGGNNTTTFNLTK